MYAEKLVKAVHYLLLLLLLLMLLGSCQACENLVLLESYLSVQSDKNLIGSDGDPPSSSDHPGTTLQQSTRGTNFETLILGKDLGLGYSAT